MVDLLAGYRPHGAIERADLDRVRMLGQSTDDPWSRANPLHLTASALIVHVASRRVLLRWHARQQAWLQVGGHADAGESDPLDIALREGAEETGLTDLVPWPNKDLVHLVIVAVPPKGNDPAHEHADLRYALATESPERARPEGAGAALRWLTFAAARDLTTEDNLRETLDRVERLMF